MNDLLDTDGVAQLLGIRSETVRGYHKQRNRSKNNFPPADTYFGRSPAWHRQTILDWDITRKTVHTVNVTAPTK